MNPPLSVDLNYYDSPVTKGFQQPLKGGGGGLLRGIGYNPQSVEPVE